VKTTTADTYFVPVVPTHEVLWQITRDRAGNTTEERPYVPYKSLLDNLHRRGVRELHVEELPRVLCREEGCYNAGPTDPRFRYHCRITLSNGQVFHGEGEACRHNTTRVTQAAMRRMAETRAKARAMRDAVNIGMVCVVELDSFRGHFRQGDRVLSDRDLGSHAEGMAPAAPAPARAQGPTQTRTAAPAASVPATSAPVPASPRPPDPSEQERRERLRVTAELHAVARSLELNSTGLHDVIHGRERVASLRDLPMDRLREWVARLRALPAQQVAALRAECLTRASGGGGS
jgi:hypothetical protein